MLTQNFVSLCATLLVGMSFNSLSTAVDTSLPCPDWMCNEAYDEAVRETLASFHINLSQGNYAANGPLNALDAQWNYDGNLLIGRTNFVNALQSTVESFAKGLQARDYYQIVDGNVGATLFALYGDQTGPVNDVPMTPGARFNTITGEVFVFNEHAQNRELWTIDQLSRIGRQVSGKEEVPSIESIPALRANPQTSPEFRAELRKNMAALHANANAGRDRASSGLATSDVVVNDNGRTYEGSEAFVDLVACRNAGLGAFPQKIFHDDYVLADGTQGMISSVWQAPQVGVYDGLEPVAGAQARMRVMMWFEFDDNALVTKVTAVYEESVVRGQLESGKLYP